MLVKEIQAYDDFLHTGKIEDYLNYIGKKQQSVYAADMIETDGDRAYYNRSDRSQRETDR